MNFLLLRKNKTSDSYSIYKSSHINMDIVANFLIDDVGYYYPSSFKEWALYDKGNYSGGNITDLEKENNKIYLTDSCSEEKNPTVVIMTIQNFVQLIDEWEEKVGKKRPVEILIKEENGAFSIKTDK